MNYGGSRPTQKIPSENNVYWFKKKEIITDYFFLLQAITHCCGLMWIFREFSSRAGYLNQLLRLWIYKFWWDVN